MIHLIIGDTNLEVRMFNIMFPSRLLFALLLALGGVCAAHADGQAVARLSNTELIAVDLTPDDGMAAGFTIRENSAGLEAYSLFNGMWEGNNTRVSIGTPASVEYARDDSRAVAATNGIASDFTMTARAGPGLEEDRLIGAMVEQYMEIAVLPHTLVMLDGEASASLDRSIHDTYGYDAEMEISIALWIMGTPDGVNYWRTLGFDDATSPSMGFSEDVGLSLANSTDENRIFGLSVVVSSKASRYVVDTPPPVPEPTQGAMLLAGMAAVVVAGRRSRSRHKH